MAGSLAGKTQPGGLDNLGKLLQCKAKFLINNNIFEFMRMRDFAAGGQQTPGNDARIILAALVQTFFQRFDAGRQDKDANRLGIQAFDLTHALPIDFEHDVHPRRRRLVNEIARRAVVVAVDLGPFEQGVALAHLRKLITRHKTVFASVHFAGTGRARRTRHGQAQGRIALEQGLDEAGFARAAGRGNKKQSTGMG